jgi:hypothetical protein
MSLHKNGSAVQTELINHVLLIEIKNPPINAGSLAVRSGLRDAIEQVVSDPDLNAAVIVGKDFRAGKVARCPGLASKTVLRWNTTCNNWRPAPATASPWPTCRNL